MGEITTETGVIYINNVSIKHIVNLIEVIKAKPFEKTIQDFKTKLDWYRISAMITCEIIMKYHSLDYFINNIEWKVFVNNFKVISEDFIRFMLNDENLCKYLEVILADEYIPRNISEDFLRYLINNEYIQSIKEGNIVTEMCTNIINNKKISEEFLYEIIDKADIGKITWYKLSTNNYFEECMKKLLKTEYIIDKIDWNKLFSFIIPTSIIMFIYNDKQIYNKMDKKYLLTCGTTEEITREIIADVILDKNEDDIESMWGYISANNKNLSNEFLLEFQDKLNWINICRNYRLPEETIRHIILRGHKNEIYIIINDRHVISQIKSESLIIELIDSGIVVNYISDLMLNDIEILKENNTQYISLYKFIKTDALRPIHGRDFITFNITEDIIRHMYTADLLQKETWDIISNYSFLTEDFITEFLFELNLSVVAKNNNVISDEFRHLIQNVYNGTDTKNHRNQSSDS